MGRKWLYLLCCITVLGCSKNDHFGPQGTLGHFDPALLNPTASKVFILNEGNFGLNNASLDIYDPDSMRLSSNVIFETSGLPLGDVAQSSTVVDSLLFIVVNNSGTVIKTRAQTAEVLERRNVGKSPRYLQAVSTNEVWVTDLGADYMYVLDMATLETKDSVFTGGWTEQLIVIGSSVYVAMPNHNRVLEIDISSKAILDSLKTHAEPTELAYGADGKLWVLCTGGTFPKEELAPKLQRFTTSNNQWVSEVEFPKTGAFAYRLRTTYQRDTIYALAGDVHRFVVGNSGVEQERVIQQYQQNFYGLGIDPHQGDIYIADAQRYTSSGRVLRYDAQIRGKDTVQVGFIPQHISFYLKY